MHLIAERESPSACKHFSCDYVHTFATGEYFLCYQFWKRFYHMHYSDNFEWRIDVDENSNVNIVS